MKKILAAIMVAVLLPASASALEVWRKNNTATYVTFPMISSADGTSYITSCGTPDSEFEEWDDSAAPTGGFADMTGEITEIGTTGVYYLAVAAGEIDQDYTVIKVTCTNALTQTVLVRTTGADPYNVAATTTAGNTIDVTATGEVGVDFSNINGTLDSGEIGTDAIGATQIAAAAITSSEAPNLDAAISTRSSHSAADVWTSGTRTLTAATNITDDGGVINVTGGAIDTVTTTTTATNLTTNNDKTGYSISGTITTLDGLNNFDPTTDTVANVTTTASVTNDVGITATAVDNIWDEDIVAAHGTDDTAGNLLSDILAKPVTLSTDPSVDLGSALAQALDDGTSWTYDRTADALEVISQAGSADWSSTEREQIRDRLGLDGTTSTPTSTDVSLWTDAASRTLTSATNITDDGGVINVTAGIVDQVAALSNNAITSNVIASGAIVFGTEATGFFDYTTNNVTVGAMSEPALDDFWTVDTTTDYSGATAGSVGKEIADNAGGSALTEAGIADAVWDEDIVAAHGTQDTAGNLLSDILAKPVTLSSDTSVDLGSALAQIMDDGTSWSFDRTTDSLEVGGGSCPTAAAISDAVWDEQAAGHTDTGKAGQQLWTDLDAVLVDTDDIQTNQNWDVWDDGTRTLTAATNITDDGGVINVTTGAIDTCTDVTNGVSLSATAVDNIWDEDIVAAHGTADTAGYILSIENARSVTLSTGVDLSSIAGQMLDNGTAWTYDRTTDALEQATALSDAVDAIWDEDIVAAHNTADTSGEILDDINTPASFKADVSNLDTTVSSRSSHSAADVWSSGTRTLTTAANITDDGGVINVTAGAIDTVTSVTNGVTVSTNSDKTGYSISGTITTLDGLNNFDATTDTVANVTTVGSVTGAVGSVTGNVGGTINGLTATALADFFDTDSLTTYSSAVSGSVVKEIADNAGGSALTEAGIADAVWDEDIVAAHNTADTAGALLDDLGTPADFKADVSNLDATVSSRSSHSAADVWSVGTRDITGGTIDTVGDKTGYSLSTAGIDSIWDEPQSGHVTAGTFGLYLDSAVSGAGGDDAATIWGYSTRELTDKSGFSISGSITTLDGLNDISASDVWTYDIPSNHAPSDTNAGGVLDKLTEETTTLTTDVALNSVVGQMLDNGTAWTYTRTTDSQEALGAGGAGLTAQQVWEYNITGVVGAGQAGNFLNNLPDDPADDSDIDSQLATIQTDLDTPNQYKADVSSLATSAEIAALNDITVAEVWGETLPGAYGAGTAGYNLDTQVSTAGSPAAIADAVWDEAQSGHVTGGTFGYYLDDQVSSAGGAAAGAIADAVWDETLADHLGAGSTGQALNAAGGAGDPWIVSLPAAYTGDQAGYLLYSMTTDYARETTLLGNITKGVIDKLPTIVNEDDVKVFRGDAKTLDFNLGSDWNLTNKKVFLTVKVNMTDDIGDAVINKEATVTDAANGVAQVTLTTAETGTTGSYRYDITVTDNDGTSNPLTAMIGKFVISQDVR